MVLKSHDGTPIAFSRIGHGPAVLLVDGALAYRGFGPSVSLAKALASHFTVFTYDRRGRGESGDTAPYSVQREIEDIDALIREAGGEAFVWGISSGAMLALETAKTVRGIRGLSLYEAPLIVDDAHPSNEEKWRQIRAAVREGRHADAAKLFMIMIDVPAPMVAIMRMTPLWRKLKRAARTLPYDADIIEDDQKGQPLLRSRWTSVTMPALVVAGGKSPQWMHNGNRALADALPNAQFRTLPGQAHNVKAKALAPLLISFFSG